MIALWWAMAAAGTGIEFVRAPALHGNEISARIRTETPPDGTWRIVVDGRPVGGSFTPATKHGTTWVVAFDGSGSFRRFHTRAFDLAERFTVHRPTNDDVGFMVFGRDQRSWAPTTDEPSLLENLAQARSAGANEKETRLAAFIREAIDQVAKARTTTDGVRKVLVFTDAGEESEVFEPLEIAEYARTKNVVVDAVVFARGDGAFASELDRLAKLVTATGGEVLELHDPDADPQRFEALIARPSTLFDVSATFCGESAPPVTISGPRGLQSPTRTASGQPLLCTPPPASPEVRPGSTAMRAVGLVCVAMAFVVLLLLAAAGWLVNRRADIVDEPSAAREPEPTPTAAPTAPEAPPPPQPPPMALTLPETHLEVVGGDLPSGRRWRFTGKSLTIGAGPDNDITVDLPQISGNHAKFELFPSGAVFVEDLGSSNGTWVDRERIAPGQRKEIPKNATIALSSQLMLKAVQPHREES